MGLFREEHPELYSELAPEQEKASTVTSGSGITFQWICPIGHRYATSPRKRVYGHNCPYCSGNKVLVGFNDLASARPDIASRWIDDDISPEKLTVGSNRKVKWACIEGHIYRRTVQEIVKGFSCRKCYDIERSKHIPLLRDTDIFNEVVDKDSSSILSSTYREKIEWECPAGHVYSASPKNRMLGRGCPYCSGHKTSPESNSLTVTYPQLACRLVNPVDGNTVTCGSSRELEWRCDSGHTFFKSVHSMVRSFNQGKSGCPVCFNKVVIKGINDFSTLQPELVEEWDDPIDPTTVTYSNRLVQWKCAQEHVWKARIQGRVRRGDGCPRCSSSQGEREVAEYVGSLLPDEDIQRNSRKVINPFELDIYVPVKGVAVEYNGIYWHSELFKDRNYHALKADRCACLGVQLITVWEDEWRDKRPIVERMIARKLGLSQEERIAARKTSPHRITSHQAQGFMDAHHIQGFKPSSDHYGLFQGDTLVAVMSILRHQGVLYLERYATSCIVQGGFTKLLTYVRSHHEHATLVTFADKSVSDGGLYESTGFEMDKVLPPDYRYVYGGQRQHKFGFRKIRFESDPNLMYDENLTERGLAELNGIPRIWDAGKIRYVLSW